MKFHPNNYAVTSNHNADFFKNNNLGFEGEILKVQKKTDWEEIKQFMISSHLPFTSSRALNLASYNDVERKEDMEYLRQAIAASAAHGIDRVIIHTCGFESIEGKLTGCYERMIDGLKTLADEAKSRKLLFCIENMVLRSPETRHLYGSSATEWFRIFDDVDSSNVCLALDTSHAASSVMGYASREEREKHLFDFLARPEIIKHIHWSDSKIENQDALFGDLHLIPGDGDLPLEFHRQVKALDALRVFEQNCSDEDSLRAMAFVDGL